MKQYAIVQMAGWGYRVNPFSPVLTYWPNQGGAKLTAKRSEQPKDVESKVYRADFSSVPIETQVGWDKPMSQSKKKRVKLHKKSDRFSREMMRTLDREFSSDATHDWKMNYALFDQRSVCVDVVGKPKDGSNGTWILIEVELHREDPASNVVKIWKSLRDKKCKAAMFHVFCRAYAPEGPKQAGADRAVFVGEQLQKDVKCPYEVIFSDFNPRRNAPKGGGKVLDHARADALTIAARLKSLGLIAPLKSKATKAGANL